MKFSLGTAGHLLGKIPKGFDPYSSYESFEELQSKFDSEQKLVYQNDNDPLTQIFVNYHYLHWLDYYAAAGTNLWFFDTTGTSRNIQNNVYPFRLNGDTGGASGYGGTNVGTGTTAVYVTDYKLATLVLHGTASGQLLYSTNSYFGPYTSGSTRYFISGRLFTNISGGDITVSEMGCELYHQTAGYMHLMARDLVSPTVTISNGTVAWFQYKFSITV